MPPVTDPQLAHAQAQAAAIAAHTAAANAAQQQAAAVAAAQAGVQAPRPQSTEPDNPSKRHERGTARCIG